MREAVNATYIVVFATLAAPLCRDVELPDPPTSRFRYGEPLPRVGSHTGYWEDPALWNAVGAAAAGLAAKPAP
ncbi:hypothetical protein [Planotetraspora sp. GP83]|uniref:hypothetical protein n=1 Tax=Planotetraspora sp. GP83 TaxID=3156264 RepID=UPI003514F4AA